MLPVCKYMKKQSTMQIVHDKLTMDIISDDM